VTAGSPEKKRPVLWTGEFVCTCGHRAHAEVLGRKGHRYDELEIVDQPDLPEDEKPTAEEKEKFDQFIHESYTAEGQGVLDVLACPRCGKRPGIKRELRKLSLWFAALLVMLGFTFVLLWFFRDRTAAVGALIAGGFAVLARAYTFFAAVLDAKDRVVLTALPKATDESASSG
jgi:hypothetical protein